MYIRVDFSLSSGKSTSYTGPRNKFLTQVVKQAYRGGEFVYRGQFGVFLVFNDKAVFSYHDMVLKHTNPTTHTDVTAVREVIVPST